MRFVNHTPHDLVVRVDGDREVVIPRGPVARLDARYRPVRRGGGLPVSVVAEVNGAGPVSIKLRAPEWSGTDLPPPEPGVVRIVSTHVAELAVLVGRPLDDLLVALQTYPSQRGRVYASLTPATHASPATVALLDEGDELDADEADAEREAAELLESATRATRERVALLLDAAILRAADAMPPEPRRYLARALSDLARAVRAPGDLPRPGQLHVTSLGGVVVTSQGGDDV